MSNLVDFIARLLISALFLISAYNKIFSIDGTMSWMEGFGIPGMLLYPTIVLEIILPLFIIVGYKAKLSAGLLAIFCIATAFIFHFDFNDHTSRMSFKFLLNAQVPSNEILYNAVVYNDNKVQKTVSKK